MFNILVHDLCIVCSMNIDYPYSINVYQIINSCNRIAELLSKIIYKKLKTQDPFRNFHKTNFNVFFFVLGKLWNNYLSHRIMDKFPRILKWIKINKTFFWALVRREGISFQYFQLWLKSLYTNSMKQIKQNSMKLCYISLNNI